MKSLYNLRRGGFEVLAVREEPDPVPGQGEVLIRVQRAGLNFADILARIGLYPDAPKTPMVMGYEVAGTVERVGVGVTGLVPGTRVLALTKFKGQASHVVTQAQQVFPLPERMSFDEGAALPVNYLTAFHMLHYVGNLRPGERLLVHMAAGGVGLATLQLARRIEGVTIFGTASASKHELLRKEGVHHPIDYRTVDYAEEVRRLTGGKGVHLVLDALGGKDLKKGYQLLAPTGRLLCFGVSNMAPGPKRNMATVLRQVLAMPRFSPLTLMGENRTVAGVNMGQLWGEAELMSGEMRQLLKLYEEGAIAPHVDKVFKLENAAEAHRYVQERKNVGKVLFDCA